MHRFEFGRGRGGHGHGGRHGGRFFGRFGGFGGGGRAFRAARMLASGDLQLIVLFLLKEKPRHGYDIIKELEERSSGIYIPSPGVVYPALTYLEEMEYASSQTEGNKKLYTITAAGLAHLEKNNQEAEETMQELERFGSKMAGFQKDYVDEENVREDFSRDARDQSRKEWRHFKSMFHELWHDMKDVLRSKMDAPMEEKERVFKILKKALEEIRKKD